LLGVVSFFLSLGLSFLIYKIIRQGSMISQTPPRKGNCHLVEQSQRLTLGTVWSICASWACTQPPGLPNPPLLLRMGPTEDHAMMPCLQVEELPPLLGSLPAEDIVSAKGLGGELGHPNCCPLRVNRCHPSMMQAIGRIGPSLWWTAGFQAWEVPGSPSHPPQSTPTPTVPTVLATEPRAKWLLRSPGQEAA
jgi:hypothetical protein